MGGSGGGLVPERAVAKVGAKTGIPNLRIFKNGQFCDGGRPPERTVLEAVGFQNERFSRPVGCRTSSSGGE